MQLSMTSALYLVVFIQSTYLLLTIHVHRGRPLLAIFLGTFMALAATYYIWDNKWLSPTTQFWVNRFTHASLYYVLGPSLYFYLRFQTLESFQLKARHLWHSLPYGLGLIAALFIIPHYLPQCRLFTQDWLFPAATWPHLLRSLHIFIYAGLVGRLVWLQFTTSRLNSFVHNLIVSIVAMGCGSIAVGMITYLLTDNHIWKVPLQQISVGCVVCMVYLINRLLSEPRSDLLTISTTGMTLSPSSCVEVPIKYQNSALDQVSASRLFEKLEIYLSTTRAYEDADLTLSQLAQALGVSTNQLSQAINQISNQTFYQLLNRYRVEAACQLLADGKQQHLSVLGIGYEVGFRSKSTYYAAFRRERGITPNVYRKLKHL